jgi:protein-L-isoaspartate(D-aspartate) O-methyltransferase
MVQDYAAARENMVENQVRTNDVTNLAIQDAMRVVARERFCPPGKDHLAYAEAEIEYAPGWFMMCPRDVAKLLEAVDPKPGEKALAIAAPYAAAVMVQLGAEVIARMPAETVKPMGDMLQPYCTQVEIGAPNTVSEWGPFDVIVVEGAVPRAPDVWAKALAVGGRLGVIERNGPVGKARVYIRAQDGSIASREVFDATPAIIKGFEPAPTFAF